jgi:methyl-accepting chemotaxis protein
MNKLKNLQSKFLVATVLAVAILTTTLGILSNYFAGKMAMDLGRRTLELKLRGDSGTANAHIENHYGKPSLKDGKLVDSKGESIEGRFERVDELKERLGVEATIFAKEGGDFKRISTTIKDAQGKRAVGTLLGSSSAAFATVSKGDLYVGDATILGQPHITAYDPIVSGKGDVIGILFIGISTAQIEGMVSAGNRRLMLYTVLVSLLAALLISAAVQWVAVKFIVRPIKRVTQSLAAVSEGDTSVPVEVRSTDEIGQMADACRRLIESNADFAAKVSAVAAGDWTQMVHPRSERDDLGRALHQLVRQVGEVLGQVRSAVEEFSGGTSQIADASQNLSQGATETAASLEQISASATQIGQQARHNAETATQANQLSAVAKQAAETGAARMASLNQSMAAITDSSAQIAKIIKTIDDIAFQTNILALNAAVEAARAGRHGKGFAVVAEEVRNLAARSAKAARETAELIEGSKGRVDEGNSIAKDTADALAEIGGGIVKVGDLVGEMAAASNEQAQGISQISQGLGQIDQVTQQNTATAEETASAAEELSGQSSQLKELLSQFRLNSEERASGRAKKATEAAKKASAGKSKALPPPPKAKAAPRPAKAAAMPAAPAGGGWDQMAKTLPARPASNEEIISLEDKEFGRY